MGLVVMKKHFLLILLIIAGNISFSETVYDDSYQENSNYIQGNKYLQNSQYSSAINEFKKAIRTNPSDRSSLIGLSNSYNMRAQYYNNTVKATDNAISDLKSAIFFLKYFASNNTDFSLGQSIIEMEKNLSILENSLKQSITPEYRLNSAQKLRTKGEFAASGFDYYQLLSNNAYAPQANSALGDIYKIFNRPDKAVYFYKNALATDSDNTEIHLKLARTYEQLNDFSASLKEYSYALNASSESEEILNPLERIWQKKVDENPKDAEARANLGVVFQKQKRYMEALNEYRRAEALNPTNINTKINIGTLYQEQKKYDMAMSVYDSILNLQPYNAKVLVYKAECCKSLNRKKEAIELLKSAMNLDPKNSAIKAKLFDLLKDTMPTSEVLDFLYKNVQNSPMNADSYYEFAYELHKANKIDDAIVYYLETIKLDKNKIDAYINLSQAYRQKKNYSDAYSIIKKAKAIQGNNELVNKQYELCLKEYAANSYSIASNAFQSGDYEKAIAEYQKINPKDSDVYIGIAASYQSLKDNQNALENYKKALELAPNNDDIAFYIASIYANMNDFVKAKEYINISLSKNSLNVQAKELLKYINDKETESLLSYAVSLYEASKYSEAIEQFNRILDINSTNATVYYYRAMAYDGLNQYNKAIEDYKSTLKYAPEMVIAYYSLGVDYDSINDYKNAKKYYFKYLELSIEDNDYRKYAQSRINEIKDES